LSFNFPKEFLKLCFGLKNGVFSEK